MVNRHLYGDFDHALYHGFARKRVELGVARFETGIEQYATGCTGESTAEVTMAISYQPSAVSEN